MAKWNPLHHPRGRDGRFIEVYGWVRWLSETGTWRRGRVSAIDKKTGTVSVQATTHTSNDHAVETIEFSSPSKSLWSAVPTKANINVPKPGEPDPAGWTKTGAQAGSNKGAKFSVNADGGQYGVVTKAEWEDVAATLSVGGSGSDKDVFARGSDGRVYTRLTDDGEWTDLDGNLISLEKVGELLGDDSTDVRFADTDDQSITAQQKLRAVNNVNGGASPGDSFYVKQPKSKMHVANEVLANDLYRLAGVNVPEVTAGKDETVVASKMILKDQSIIDATPDQLTEAREDFAIDAWLGNWDVVGLGYDNIVISDGKPARIDAGGALLYRAMGSPKGSLFGDKVNELDSMRDASINPQSALVFGDASPADLVDGAKRVGAIHPNKIRQMVDDSGLPSSLADTLIARRADLLKRLGVKDPHDGLAHAADPVPVVAPGGESGAKTYDHFADGTLIAGATITASEIFSPTFSINELRGKTFVVVGGVGGTPSVVHFGDDSKIDVLEGFLYANRMSGMTVAMETEEFDYLVELPAHADFDPARILAPLKVGDHWEYGGKIVATFESGKVYIDGANAADGRSRSSGWVSNAGAREFIFAHAIPPQTPVTKKMSGKAATLKAAVTADTASSGSGVLILSDGTPAIKGVKVVSVKDGLEGIINGWPNQEKYPGLVWVKTSSGKLKGRKLSTLKSVAPTPAPAAGPYDHLKTKDGKIPVIGQKVRAGKTSAQVEGVIVKINPNNGYVYVQDDAGKKHIKTHKTVEVLEDVDETLAGLPEVVVAVADVPATSVKAKKPAAAKVKYPSKTGEVVFQPDATRTKYTDASSLRKLSRDGYAPIIGMSVRDRNGQLGVVARISHEHSSTPAAVGLYYPDAGKIAQRQWRTVYVDHEANLTNALGEKIENVVKIENPSGLVTVVSVPVGTKIYRYETLGYSSGSYVSTEAYEIGYFNPNGKFVKITAAGAQTTGMTLKDLAENNGISSRQIGVYNPDAQDGKTLLVKPPSYSAGRKHKGRYKFTGVGPDAESFSAAFAVGGADVINDGPPGSYVTPTMVPLESLAGLGPPANAVESHGPETAPPVVTGTTADLASNPTNAGKSLLGSIMEKITLRRSKAPLYGGKAVRYGVGDSTHVEDMSFRTQVVRDEQGTEYLDVRFRLTETSIDDLARSLMGDTSAKGGWTTASGKTAPDKLGEGDVIAIRIGSNSTAHKLGTVPNARVIKTPELVGKQGKLDLYRVQFMTSDGNIGEIDLQARPTPSVDRYQWDPTHVTPGQNKAPSGLTPLAMQAGWTLENGMWIDGKYGTANIDADGASLLGERSRIHERGFHATRTLDNGTRVSVNMAHPSDATITNTGSGSGVVSITARNANFNGEVRIRIPLATVSSDDMDRAGVESSISSAMESVGIAPSAQTISDSAMSELIRRKIITQYGATYDGRSEDAYSDKKFKAAIARLNKVVRPHLGRDVTANDFRIYTHESGRAQVVTSPELAKAITKSQGNRYYTHSGLGSADHVVETLSGTHAGLMSTDERWSAGIITIGSSSKTDVTNGSGDRVYLQGKTNTPKTGGASGTLWVSAPALNSSTEVYANSSDNYGKRTKKNDFITQGGAYEYMYKRRLEPEQIAYVFHSSYKEIIATLKKRGITHIGGRPIEEVIFSPMATIPYAPGTPEFENIGVIGESGVTYDSVGGVVGGTAA